MNTRPSAVQCLAEQLNLPAEVVGIGYRTIREALKAHRNQHHPTLSPEAYLRMAFADGYAVTLIAAASFRLLRRDADAQLVEAVHDAAHPSTPHTAPSAGCAPEDADHPQVQAAVAILTAAGLPPIDSPRGHGFQVLPADAELPGWVFIAPDRDAPIRPGFAGGTSGYENVLRLAGWLTRADAETGLLGACPREHVQAALAARDGDEHRPA
ncbi:hypothetical protein AB0O82_10585 [Kitasatospora sp. NPDC088264]|uniref:hypothetical protein n=1 Tax=Kitasatospora sp. NPDC088264 TaxID=3155296 RepID=UPI0034486714